ncbi:hypothetical protein AYO49_04200 [Verrucomicrobiaceae bacterium SCGC AG-212-N21]|nr:hypothetical protein AYO49_04200 [Verrucomicrobiaceae bacterium SCGC AG-212-N21]
MPTWHSRAYQLTRERGFIARWVTIIVGLSTLIAVVLHISRPSSSQPKVGFGFPTELNEELYQVVMQRGVKELEALKEPAPAHLITWIRECAKRWHGASGKAGFDAVALRLGTQELHPLIAKHTTSEAQCEAVAAYVRFRFLAEGEARTSALQTLEQLAKKPSPPHAGELLGDALLFSHRSEEALQAYLRDVATPGAVHARKWAVDLALSQNSEEVLSRLAADKLVTSDLSPEAQWKLAKRTGNRALLFNALWHMQWVRWLQGAAVPIALFAAAIWYIILVHTGSREPMRWWRYLAAVLGGIASVALLHWWQGTLSYSSGDPEDAPTMTHEMLQWIMHVGLPEEAAKLLCFAFFLPVLLHHRSGVKAALSAGCVGLGFALDENLHYFRDHGPQVAIGRLLTANFMHISLTGIVGWHLYELFRSRFNHATEFLIAFCGVVVAHGLYDFGAGAAANKWGFDIASFIILAMAAKIYLPMLHDTEGRQPGMAISRTAVFCLGTALLVGMLMIVMVWQLQSLQGITTVLRALATMALVVLIYIQEWREVH